MGSDALLTGRPGKPYSPFCPDGPTGPLIQQEKAHSHVPHAPLVTSFMLVQV